MQRIKPKNSRLSSAIAFGTDILSGILTSIVWLILAQHAYARPEKVPRDVLKLRADGYVYADYPGVFDDAEGEGITIEAWIYLTEPPQDGDYHDSERRWIIFAKPFSYFATIAGRYLGSDLDRRDPEGTLYIRFGVQQRRRAGGLSTASSGWSILPHEFELKRWVHVAYQIAVKENHTDTISYYDGDRGGHGFGSAMRRTDAPLLIGGTKRIGRFWGTEYGSMKGYIDDVRVSKGFRYSREPGNRIRPKRRLQADERTIALWRLEEGPGATRYGDSSGNGYTLRAGGSLAVEAGGKLATSWGSLKRRALEGK
ncbi:MAG: hypothetical protein OXI86_20620 [Candidatus Poribacteria bacterium]|nr:hypothetical protein [Candidatus Poribacteria bacterium]